MIRRLTSPDSGLSDVRKDSVVFGVAGIFFGLLVGWIIGSQQAAPPPRRRRSGRRPPRPPPAQSAPALDESRAARLRAAAERNPQRRRDARVQLGNLYFDAERFDDAVQWYEEALKIDPRTSTPAPISGSATTTRTSRTARSRSSSARWRSIRSTRRRC